MVELKKPVTLIKLERLHSGVIQGRTSLFTVRALLDGGETTVYLNNTGRLKGIVERGKRCYCIPNSPRAKLKYRLVGVGEDGEAILVDTSLQERAFIEAVERDLIPWLSNCVISKRNVALGESIIDYELKCSDKAVLVELKSAVMKLDGGFAGYPDAPTPRGRHQIRMLGEYVSRGGHGVVVFIAGVPRARGFRLYCVEDREIGEIAREAFSKGLSFRSIGLYLDVERRAITLYDTDLPVDLNCT